MTYVTNAGAGSQPEILKRRGGMIAWGVFLIVIGALAALGLLEQLAGSVSAYERSLAPPRFATGRPAGRPLEFEALFTLLPGLIAAAALVWTGIGACRGRRWVRPVLMAIAGFVVAWGIVQFIAMTLNVPHLLDLTDVPPRLYAGVRTAATPASISVLIVYGIHAGLTLLSAVLLPYLLYRFFASDVTAATLDALDPGPAWTDRCSPAALAWVGMCALGSVGALLRLSHPAVPAFTFVVTAEPAMIALAVCAVLLAWGAWLCYRREPWGWVISFVVVAIMNSSTAVYLWLAGTTADLYSDWTGAPQPVPSVDQRLVAPWLNPTMATIVAALMIGFGLFVAPRFLAARENSEAAALSAAGESRRYL